MIRRKLPMLFVGLLLGIFITHAIPFVYAQISNTVIHGCVRNGTGILRVITSGNCLPAETALDWNQQGPMGPTGATGNGGSGSNFGGYTTNQLVGLEISSTSYDYRDFEGANFTQSQLAYVTMRYSNFRYTNFTNASLDQISYNNADLSNSNFTNVQIDNNGGGESDMTNANFSNTDFTGAIFNFLTGTIIKNTNFTNANFTDASLVGMDFTNSTRTGVIWSNTTCPDGTNSDNNGNTCEGHLVP